MEILIGGLVALLTEGLKRWAAPKGSAAVRLTVFIVSFVLVAAWTFISGNPNLVAIAEQILAIAVSAVGVYELILKRLPPEII